MMRLGCLLLWKSLAKIERVPHPADGAARAHGGQKNNGLFKGWPKGPGTKLLNPKVQASATSPPFPADISPLLKGILLAGVHCPLAMVWFTLLMIRLGLCRALGQRGAEASAPSTASPGLSSGFRPESGTRTRPVTFLAGATTNVRSCPVSSAVLACR
jgi:hypothetical protein